MPYASPRICSNCRKVHTGRCEQTRERAKQYEAQRLSPSKRGYGRPWQRLSEQYRNAHPLCEECQRQGKIKSAECVDHIEPHRGDNTKLLNWDNLQSLCWSCHSRKTAREDGGFGNKQ